MLAYYSTICVHQQIAYLNLLYRVDPFVRVIIIQSKCTEFLYNNSPLFLVGWCSKYVDVGNYVIIDKCTV